MPTGSSLADALRARRAALGLTQAELAERAGISERAVSDMERGLRRAIYRDTAERLIQALGLAGEAARHFAASARGRAARPREYGDTPLAPRTEMFGRASETAALAALLRDPSTRLVTLTGPGGVGKTRLALELWPALAESFPDGRALVALGDLRDPALVLPALATAVKAPTGAGAAALARHLATMRLLLVLDTMEHLLEASPSLAEVVAGCSPTTVLVTSRVPLNIRAERLMPIAPLPPDDAVRMFDSCLAAMQAAPASPADRALSAGICERLDGLPLAIELAAARARLLGPAEIRHHLERRLPLLTGGPVDLPERQRSMAGTIAWSYDLLAGDDRRLLEQLSVFAGGWTASSAGQVCTPTADGLLAALGRLADANLVLPGPGSGGRTRYRMLDTVREYAADRLSARDEGSSMASLGRRHAEHYCAVATEAEPELRRAGHQDCVERLSADRDNLRAALGWAIAQGDAAIALRMCGALWMFWRVTGAFAEGRAWLQQALAMEAPGCEPVRAGALWGSGWLAFQQGDWAETARSGSELVAWATKAGDDPTLRNGHTLLGQERLAAEDYPVAASEFDKALILARRARAPWLVATSTLNRATAAEHQGDLALATDLLREAETQYRELGDDRFMARCWLQQAYVALLEGKPARAQEKVLAGLALNGELGDPWGIAEQLDAAAAALAAAGNRKAAAFAAGAARTAWAGIGASPHPTDRRSAQRWLTGILDGDDQLDAVSDGGTAETGDAVARVLEHMHRLPH